MSKFTKVRAPQDSAFDLDRARELLALVAHAHYEFEVAIDKEIQHHPWQWDTDTTPITVNGKVYKVLKRFGFAGYFFTLKNPSDANEFPFAL